MDLTDLNSVKACADELLKREEKLDALILNAGIQMIPATGKTVQGHELRVGANNLGHYLLMQKLLPTLKTTASFRAKTGCSEGCVRILWAGSCLIDLVSPTGGVELDEAGVPKTHNDAMVNYAQSKAGNLFLAKHFKDELKKEGILSVVSQYSPIAVPVKYMFDRTISSASIQATSMMPRPSDGILSAQNCKQRYWSGHSCIRSSKVLTPNSGLL